MDALKQIESKTNINDDDMKAIRDSMPKITLDPIKNYLEIATKPRITQLFPTEKTIKSTLFNPNLQQNLLVSSDVTVTNNPFNGKNTYNLIYIENMLEVLDDSQAFEFISDTAKLLKNHGWLILKEDYKGEAKRTPEELLVILSASELKLSSAITNKDGNLIALIAYFDTDFFFYNLNLRQMQMNKSLFIKRP